MVEEVREGFLCPLCMKDMGDVVRLKVNYLSFILYFGEFRFILRIHTQGRTLLFRALTRTSLAK